MAPFDPVSVGSMKPGGECFSVAARIERHRAFLAKSPTKRPLMGCISGWEDISKYVPDVAQFWPAGDVAVATFAASRFLPLYRGYAKTLDQADDLLRTLEPLPFFPWAEAAIGCPVTYTGKNFWSSPIEETKTDEGLGRWIARGRAPPAPPRIPEGGAGDRVPAGSAGQRATGGQWSSVYRDLLDALSEQFGGRLPIGQGILRGPLDLVAAVLGEERMIYLFFDQPELMKELLQVTAGAFLEFVGIHRDHLPAFRHGHVIGSYYLWVPGHCLRLQEDAMALLSPELYREFVHPIDCRIAAEAEFTLFHLHSTGMHLLNTLLENKGVRILQVSKDEGVELGFVLSGLKKIQEAGKCLVLKGRLNREELQLLKKNLDFRGLCVQAVVRDQDEADQFRMSFP